MPTPPSDALRLGQEMVQLIDNEAPASHREAESKKKKEETKVAEIGQR